MKGLIIMLSMFMAFYSSISYASPSIEEDDIKDGSLKNPGGRPKAPARGNVYAMYDAGYVYISFTRPEGWCTVTVMSFDAPVKTILLDSTAPMPIYIGDVCDISLCVETEAGQTYYIEMVP